MAAHGGARGGLFAQESGRGGAEAPKLPPYPQHRNPLTNILVAVGGNLTEVKSHVEESKDHTRAMFDTLAPTGTSATTKAGTVAPTEAGTVGPARKPPVSTITAVTRAPTMDSTSVASMSTLHPYDAVHYMSPSSIDAPASGPRPPCAVVLH